MKYILAAISFCLVSAGATAKTCTGQIKEVNQWSDGQDNRINFTLVNGNDRIKVSTTTKEHVSMVLLAFASEVETKVYWSCANVTPLSCNETESFPLCGYISLNKY